MDVKLANALAVLVTSPDPFSATDPTQLAAGSNQYSRCSMTSTTSLVGVTRPPCDDVTNTIRLSPAMFDLTIVAASIQNMYLTQTHGTEHVADTDTRSAHN